MATSAKATSFPKSRSHYIVVGLWVMVILAGLILMSVYTFTAGAVGPISSQWPQGTHLELAKDRPTLIMFLHPKCPCSSASLDEASRFLSKHPDAFALEFVFFQPETEHTDWSQTGLWKSAAALPNTTVRADMGAREAQLFGALTSGHTFVYNPDGQLLFQGGITAGRGAHGDSAGLEALALLADGKTTTQTPPVFGCAIAK